MLANLLYLQQFMHKQPPAQRYQNLLTTQERQQALAKQERCCVLRFGTTRCSACRRDLDVVDAIFQTRQSVGKAGRLNSQFCHMYGLYGGNVVVHA